MKKIMARYSDHEFEIDLPFDNESQLNKARTLYKQTHQPTSTSRDVYLKFYLQFCPSGLTIDDIKPIRGTLDVYKRKYGETEGTIKYNEKNKRLSVSTESLKLNGKTDEEIEKIQQSHRDKSSHSLNSYIKRYGKRNGERKYKSYRVSMNDIDHRKFPSQSQYWIDRGYTENESNELVSEFQRKTLDKCVKLYGDSGYDIYKEQCRKKGEQSTLPWFVSIYGEIDGLELYNERCKSVGYHNTIDGYIDRFGKIDGCRLYNERCDKIGYSNTLVGYIDKYGDELGRSLYLKRNTKLARGRASKESLKVFIPIYKQLRLLGVSRDDIYIGVDGSREWFISKLSTKYYLYDLTIKSLNLIFEYNGEHVHPNPKWIETDREKWDNWKSVYSKESSQTVFESTKLKLDIAIDSGFEVVELWSSDSIEYNISKCEEIIKEKINEIEM